MQRHNQRPANHVPHTAVITLVAIAIVLLFSTVVFAQDDAGDAPQTTTAFEHFVTSGGPIAWFVLIPLSAVVVSLSIEHFITIRRKKLIPDDLSRMLRQQMARGHFSDAVKVASKHPSLLARVMSAGMGEASNGYPAMRRAIEEAIDERSARIFRKIEYLNIIGNVSPMIGLLGTVFGMIEAFSTVVQAGGIPDAGQLAGGISVALVTTFWGLLVAIPALSVFAILRNRVDVIAAECALICEGLLRALKQAEGAPQVQRRTAQGDAPSAPSTQYPAPAPSGAAQPSAGRTQP